MDFFFLCFLLAVSFLQIYFDDNVGKQLSDSDWDASQANSMPRSISGPSDGPRHGRTNSERSWARLGPVGQVALFDTGSCYVQQVSHIHPASRGGAAHTASLFWIVTRTHTHT